VEEGETPAAALARELHEELGIRVEVGRALGRAEARVGRRTIALTVYEARWLDGEIVPREHDRWLWATAADMRNLRWAPADVPLVPRVAERLG
jgi:8-oxo-dGTP diphosphatase